MGSDADVYETAIARTGVFTDRSGARVELKERDLAEIASTYDPELGHANLILTHDGVLAHGWVDGLRLSDGVLYARLSQISDAIKELTRRGAVKYKSLYFDYNVVPGKKYLKHVAALGVDAPAIPGLGALEFSDAGKCEIIDFNEYKSSDKEEDMADEKTSPHVFEPPSGVQLSGDIVDALRKQGIEVRQPPAAQLSERERSMQEHINSLMAEIQKRDADAKAASALAFEEKKRVQLSECVRAGMITPAAAEKYSKLCVDESTLTAQIELIKENPHSSGFSEHRENVRDYYGDNRDIVAQYPELGAMLSNMPGSFKNMFSIDPDDMAMFKAAKKYVSEHAHEGMTFEKAFAILSGGGI